MNELRRGQKGKLADIGCSGPFSVAVEMGAAGLTIDVACFGLNAESRLSDDRFMVFFNQKASPANAIVLDARGNASVFAIDLAKLPDAIHRLVFTATVDGDGTMQRLGQSGMTLGSALFRFSGADFKSEKAIIVGEVYRRDGAWRYGAVGQGFAGGLSALLAHFGGTEVAAAAAPAAPLAKISLSKVTLTKAGERHVVSLIKSAGAPSKLVVRASWVDNGDDDDGNDDLDLRVGILLPDGRMKFVTAPERSGAFDSAPFVRHLGDVTKVEGTLPATETVEVNPAIAQLSGGRVALVFSVYSAVANGAVSVASLKPRMRMEYGDQVVECAFDFRRGKHAGDSAVYTYVIGTAVIDADRITLGPSGRTSAPHSEQTPWLQWYGNDARLTMDGPVVFKGEDASDHNDDNPRRYS
jgi:tellurite resistance protein TerA